MPQIRSTVPTAGTVFRHIRRTRCAIQPNNERCHQHQSLQTFKNNKQFVKAVYIFWNRNQQDLPAEA